jgi:pyruvate/2-oxoglutarate dehydrogenase complex dihydrolipoamide dehydrogenase (E3) component
MAQAEHFDALIVGSGTGGTQLALALGGAGKRVAVVERRWIGGSCPNVNCLPSKNEIFTAKIIETIRRYAGQFGSVAAPFSVDMVEVRARKRVMVEELSAAILEAYKANDVTLVSGDGRFVEPRTVEVVLNGGDTRMLTAGQIYLNLGTRASIPPLPGLAASGALTNIEALELDRVPAHLLVLGGGYVALELAQAFSRFGSRVTIIERQQMIASREDLDIGTEILRFLTEEGIDIVTSAEALRVDGRSGQEIRLHLRTASGTRDITASDILVATGRKPNTTGIGLEIADVALDTRGYIKVGDRLETSAPGIWALGECAGSPQFTHVSYDDCRVLQSAMAGGQRTTANRLVPYSMFTDPPLARVGLSESQARRAGIGHRVAKLPMKAVLRTRTTGETAGFMKAVIDASSDRILGFAMIGAEASEIMPIVQTAMLAGMPYTGLRDAIFAHPTLAEGLIGLFSGVPAMD